MWRNEINFWVVIDIMRAICELESDIIHIFFKEFQVFLGLKRWRLETERHASRSVSVDSGLLFPFQTLFQTLGTKRRLTVFIITWA